MGLDLGELWAGSVGQSGRELVVAGQATDGDVDAFAEFFRAAWQHSGPDAPGFAGATDESIAELTTRDGA